jgi:hypothetical protein
MALGVAVNSNVGQIASSKKLRGKEMNLTRNVHAPIHIHTLICTRGWDIVLLYISTDLLRSDWLLSYSKGRLLPFQRSFLLFPYHSFHLICLDILLKAPFRDSILVLLRAE